MANEIQGIDYETALANLRASSLELRGDLPEKNELLIQFHPDYQANARVKLPSGRTRAITAILIGETADQSSPD